jgi:hypothetical protein
MKKFLTFVLSFVLVFAVVSVVSADKPTSVNSDGVETAWVNTNCADIQSGTITDSAGNPIAMGFDQYGYNYQAHMFNGYADNFRRQTHNEME